MSTAFFAGYQYQQAGQQKQAKEKEDLIFPDWKIQDVQEIQIQSGQVEKKIQLVRTADSLWHLQTPLKDLANTSAVLNWVENVLSEKGTLLKPNELEKNAATENTINWSEYGLTDNVRTITLKSESKKIQLLISHYSAFDGSFFLRKNKQLLLGSTAWARLSEQSTDLLRSYQLFNISQRPLSLKYQSKKFRLHVNWKKHSWQWPQATPVEKQFALSQSELESYWTVLSKIEFQKTNIYPKTKVNQKKYGLLTPSIQLSLQFAPPIEEWTAKFSKKNNLFYVSISNRNYIFTLKPNQVEQILLTEMRVRNHKKPLEFNPNQVQLIELKGNNLDLQFKRDKDQWVLFTTLQSNKEKNPVKDDKEKTILKALSKEPAISLLNRISDLSVNEYVGHIKNFTPTHFLVLRDKEKNQLLKLQFSNVFKKDNSEQVYMLSSAEKDMMTISAKDFKGIFLPKLDSEEDAKQKNQENSR